MEFIGGGVGGYGMYAWMGMCCVLRGFADFRKDFLQ